jgi:hypothetical protein
MQLSPLCRLHKASNILRMSRIKLPTACKMFFRIICAAVPFFFGVIEAKSDKLARIEAVLQGFDPDAKALMLTTERGEIKVFLTPSSKGSDTIHSIQRNPVRLVALTVEINYSDKTVISIEEASSQPQDPKLASVKGPWPSFQEKPKSFEVGGLRFQHPVDWVCLQAPALPIKAQMVVPSKGDLQPADITFSHSGQALGDGVHKNIELWLNQFDDKTDSGKFEQVSLGGRKVHIIYVEGFLRSAMDVRVAAECGNYSLLGAIVEGPEGLISVKMTGPKATVTESREKFLLLIESAVVTGQTRVLDMERGSEQTKMGQVTAKALSGFEGTVDKMKFGDSGIELSVTYPVSAGVEEHVGVIVPKSYANFDAIERLLKAALDSRRIVDFEVLFREELNAAHQPYKFLMRSVSIRPQPDSTRLQPDRPLLKLDEHALLKRETPNNERLPKDYLEVAGGVLVGPVFVVNNHPSRRIRYTITVSEGFGTTVATLRGVVDPEQKRFLGERDRKMSNGSISRSFEIQSASFDSP